MIDFGICISAYKYKHRNILTRPSDLLLFWVIDVYRCGSQTADVLSLKTQRAPYSTNFNIST
ncbi:hypothetical protein HanIR_Chr14g0687601 [Helianthus annuus]|nr:hypothetical protein HanIR_Chr14g0687601 [Helianthus annuus]